MSFNGTIINKANGGLGGGEASDRIAVMVVGCGDIADKLEHCKAYELLQIEDAERRGLTENDATAGQLAYYHLSEVFRLSPETSVHLIAVPTATKASDLKNLPAFIAALRGINGVNTIAVAGLTKDADLQTAVGGLQILVDDLAKDHIYIDAVLMEGAGGYLKPDIADYDDLRGMVAPNVSVTISHDPAVAMLNAANANHAAIGSALGMLMVRSIHENLGSVDIEVKPRNRKAEEDYTLTDKKTERWLDAALSNGTPFNQLSQPDQKKLNELAYIYIGAFSGYAGFFFSNSHTCTEAGDDYCFVERNAIWNKAARIIRKTLIPRIRGKVEADPASGFIKETTITDWDGRVRKALGAMITAKDVAEFDIYLDPKQAAVSTKPFRIKVRLVADGVVHEFEIDLGFTNKT